MNHTLANPLHRSERCQPREMCPLVGVSLPHARVVVAYRSNLEPRCLSSTLELSNATQVLEASVETVCDLFTFSVLFVELMLVTFTVELCNPASRDSSLQPFFYPFAAPLVFDHIQNRYQVMKTARRRDNIL